MRVVSEVPMERIQRMAHACCDAYLRRRDEVVSGALRYGKKLWVLGIKHSFPESTSITEVSAETGEIIKTEDYDKSSIKINWNSYTETEVDPNTIPNSEYTCRVSSIEEALINGGLLGMRDAFSKLFQEIAENAAKCEDPFWDMGN